MRRMRASTIRIPQAVPALLALILAAPAFASDISCDYSSTLKPEYEVPAGQAACRSAALAECGSVITSQIDGYNRIKDQHVEACQKLKNLQSTLVTISGQDNAMASTAMLYGQMAEYYRGYVRNLESIYKDMGNKMLAPDGPLGGVPSASLSVSTITGSAREKQQIRDAIVDSKKWSEVTPGPSSTLTQADNTPSLFAARNGAKFMKSVRDEIADASNTLATISQEHARAMNNQRFLQNVPSPSPSPSTITTPSSIPSMQALMGLASAGMGLAGAMKKSSISNPNLNGTSPTPDSMNVNGPNGPATSALGVSEQGDGAVAPGVNFAAAPPGAAPKAPGGPLGGAPAAKSDVTRDDAPALTPKGFNPAVGKAGGGSGGAKGGSGGGDPVVGREPSSSAAAQAKKDEDALQNFAGGLSASGLGGGSGGASATAPEPPTPAEESMKDLLHEMKDAAEGGEGAMAGLEEGQTQTASEADIAMTDDDLFPRVHSCYTRNLKQGKLHDALADQIAH